MKKNIYLLTLIGFIMLSGCKHDPAPVAYTGTPRQAILDNILTRRSIRKYKEMQVSKAQIDTIMKCAIFAPSALNQQPWEIRVIQNAKLLTDINRRFLNYAQGKTLKGSAARYKEADFSIFHHAPTVIVIARDKSNAISYLDCGILLQNILLSAHAMGLGTCPLGTLVSVLNLPENKDILDAINIPDGYEVAINIALGYPDEQPVAPERYPERVKVIE
jgi:nitroreductase